MKRSLFIVTLFSIGFFVIPAHSQDYPYEDPPSKSGKKGDDLPVESPEDLEKGGTYHRRTSIFRMGLKGGGNYSYYQNNLATPTVTLSGFGVEARLSFGWDLAYQPVFLETEFGYRGLNLSTTGPLHVITVQEGLYYRERLGKTSMWKPGLLTSLDLRIEPGTAGAGSSTSVFPALGVTSLWEMGAFLFQASVYFHRSGLQGAFISSALLAGIRF